MKSLEELKTTKNSLGYIDIYERTKEYFKAVGVFRKRKYFHGEAASYKWEVLAPEKEEEA